MCSQFAYVTDIGARRVFSPVDKLVCIGDGSSPAGSKGWSPGGVVGKARKLETCFENNAYTLSTKIIDLLVINAQKRFTTFPG